MLLAKMMGEEYREMYPNAQDATTKMAFRNGFTGFKSDSTDHILSHCQSYKITLVLFYDAQIYLDTIMKNLATKILDVFKFKFEAELEEEQW
jgi:hypothetical protein